MVFCEIFCEYKCLCVIRKLKSMHMVRSQDPIGHRGMSKIKFKEAFFYNNILFALGVAHKNIHYIL